MHSDNNEVPNSFEFDDNNVIGTSPVQPPVIIELEDIEDEVTSGNRLWCVMFWGLILLNML